MNNEQTYQWATVILLFVVLGVILFTYQDFGITWDEYVQQQYGQHIVNYYLSLGQDTSALNYKNLYLYGGFFDSIAAVLTKILPGDTYAIRHLFNAMIGFIGLIGTLKLANLLAGPRAAFLAVLLLALEPFYLGNMFNNPKDLPFATAYVWSLYYILSTFRYFPFIPRVLAIKLGVAIGVALSIRIGGVLLYGYFLLAILFYVFRPGMFTATDIISGKPASWRWRMVKSLFLILLISQAMMLFFWPWAQQAPTTRPIQALLAMSQFAWQGSVLFQGEYINAHHLPSRYLLQHFIIKLSETVILSIIAGSFMLLWLMAKKRYNAKPITENLYLFVAIASIFPILYASISNAVLYDTIRHFLFIIPLLCVISAVTIHKLIGAATVGSAKKGRQRSPYLVFALAVLLVTPQLYAINQLHPYEYVYYNQFVGGLKGASGRYETDYWASSYKEVVAVLVKHLKQKEKNKFAKRQYKIHVCTPVFPASYYFPKNFKLEKQLEKADYYISITRWNCHLKGKGKKIATVSRAGVDLSIIKAIH